MNKKILLGAVILGGTLLYYSKKKGTSTGTETPSTPQSIFSKYNNQIVVDATGKWILIKDGKLYNPLNQESLTAFAIKNPNVVIGTVVPEDIWNYYADTDNSVFGGAF